MKDWYDIYAERMNDRYLAHVASKYAPFLTELYQLRIGHSMTEIGCGAGTITRLVREMEGGRTRDHHLIDSCPKMLGLAMLNNPVPWVSFTCADMLKWLPVRSDVVHSHGLLEHFSDRDILRLVHNSGANLQFHYVPSAMYETPSRGDERLMEPDQWKKILKELGRSYEVSVSTFNDDFDIIIRIER